MFLLREARKKRGLKQKDLADLIGVDASVISRWECGKSIPTAPYIKKLSDALDVSMDFLMTEMPGAGPNEAVIKEEKKTTERKTHTLKQDMGVLVFEEGGKHYEMPATPENQQWFRELVAEAIANKVPGATKQA